MPTYEGSNKQTRGSYTILDTGPMGETCENSHEYRIKTSSITSQKVIGYCLNLPNNPANWKIETGDHVDPIRKVARLEEPLEVELDR